MREPIPLLNRKIAENSPIGAQKAMVALNGCAERSAGSLSGALKGYLFVRLGPGWPDRSGDEGRPQ